MRPHCREGSGVSWVWGCMASMVCTEKVSEFSVSNSPYSNKPRPGLTNQTRIHSGLSMDFNLF